MMAASIPTSEVREGWKKGLTTKQIIEQTAFANRINTETQAEQEEVCPD